MQVYKNSKGVKFASIDGKVYRTDERYTISSMGISHEAFCKFIAAGILVFSGIMCAVEYLDLKAAIADGIIR